MTGRDKEGKGGDRQSTTTMDLLVLVLAVVVEPATPALLQAGLGLGLTTGAKIPSLVGNSTQGHCTLWSLVSSPNLNCIYLCCISTEMHTHFSILSGCEV